MPSDKPQWEVLITQASPPNPEEPETGKLSQNKKKQVEEMDDTVLIFRIHHALADGVSGQ